MIVRYKGKELDEIWSDQSKYEHWRLVEIAVLEAKAKLGLVPLRVVDDVRRNAVFTVEEINEQDKILRHDMNAFIKVVQRSLSPETAREFHNGLTSYDVEEPATALLMMKSIDIIIDDVVRLKEVVFEKAKEHKYTIQIGRTHGQHAEPITFGLKLLNFYDSLGIGLEFLQQAEETISYGKISGAVGTYVLDPKVEELVCENLGIKPAPVSTQILQRSRHAKVMSALAVIAGTIEQMAIEFRILSMTEIGEVREPFSKKQMGSSTMSHKKNSIILERCSGQPRVLKGNLIAAMENIVSWSERDISQSSVERVIFPDSFQLLDYMLGKMTQTIEGLEVFPERMKENMELTYGAIASQELRLLLLDKGVAPESAYRLTQKLSFEAMQTRTHLKELVQKDKEISGYFNTPKSKKELEACFNYSLRLKYINEIFARFHI